MTKIKHLKYYLLLLFAGLLLQSLAQSEFPEEKGIRKMIRKEQNDCFLSLLKDGLLNNYQPAKRPLLYYALRFNNNTILKYLLDFGADPDTWYKNKNMLMWAVRFNRPTGAQLLLEYGADVDAANKQGVTAVMMAAWMDHASIMKLLIRHGADIYRQDNAGNSSIRLAVYKCEESTGYEMDTRLFMRKQVEARHDYVDGPYVTYLNDSLANVLYTYYDVSDSSVKRIDSLFKTRDGNFAFEGFVFDTLSYRIELPALPQQEVFSNVEKVFAINDVHGYYDKFTSSLHENGVVDKHMNWSFGKGHLVINGDVFDRGEGVTETLWLIYRLEKQARADGGYVHFLLGNHEIMILENDNRYLAPKYRFFANHFGWNYSMFFTRNSFFGKWLRAHNSIVKINDNLFVHGGISYSFYQQAMSVEDINEQVRYKLDNYLVSDDDPLFSMSGPFWYRGYLWNSTEFKRITEEELDEVLAFYEVKHIIVGHTITEQIQSLYNNKIIALSAPFCESGARIYALLIRNGKYFRVSGKEQDLLF